MSITIYHDSSFVCSQKITEHYSTSFSLGIKTLSKEFQKSIYAIYGMVRLADEIVDTFHGFEQKTLLDEFKKETFDSIERGISLNPILQSFQLTVNQYNIPHHLIHSFFDSMHMDLNEIQYDNKLYNQYIYGSAEVVGLMCLHIFCKGDIKRYNELLEPAKALGAAFQKVNFLRDLSADTQDLGRMYFPKIDFSSFTKEEKELIEEDIKNDFLIAYQGILKLPDGAKLGVLIAYRYYVSLLKKIKKSNIATLKSERISVSNFHKLFLLAKMVVANYIGYKSRALKAI